MLAGFDFDQVVTVAKAIFAVGAALVAFAAAIFSLIDLL